MPKKDKVPPPGNKKDEFTNFYSKAKWKGLLNKGQLDLAGRNLRPTGALIVGAALAKNKWVMILDLSNNNFGDQGAIELAQILKLNTTLQSVNLACNNITCIGAVALASAFVPYSNPTGQPSMWNRSISYLGLSGNRIRDDGFVALVSAAACHRDLTRIDLSHNEVGGMGPKALLRCMERNPFCAIQLTNNRLGDEGVQHLCAAYRRWGGKGAQATLCLSNNDVSKGGAEAIGALLSSTEFVQDVFLANNTLGYKGTEAFVAPLLAAERTMLRVLNLNNNCLGDDGAEQVAKLIEANLPTLIRVFVGTNDISDRGGIALAVALRQNTYLQQFVAPYNTFGEPTYKELAVTIPKAKELKLIDIKTTDGVTPTHSRIFEEAKKENPDSTLRVDCGAIRGEEPISVERLSALLEKFVSAGEAIKAAEEKAKQKKGGKKKGAKKAAAK